MTTPSTLAVSDALRLHRTRLGLSLEQLAEQTRQAGHFVDAGRIDLLEAAQASANVDELIVLAYALRTTPTDLLSHVPDESPAIGRNAALATALPEDIGVRELRDWIAGRTLLDLASRTAWHADRLDALSMRATHITEQIAGAVEEVAQLQAASRGGTRLPLLFDQISRGEQQLAEVETEMALTDRTLSQLRG